MNHCRRAGGNSPWWVVLLLVALVLSRAPSAHALLSGRMVQPGKMVTFEALPGGAPRWKAGQAGKMPPRIEAHCLEA